MQPRNELLIVCTILVNELEQTARQVLIGACQSRRRSLTGGNKFSHCGSADRHDELAARCDWWHLESFNFGPSRPNMLQDGNRLAFILKGRLSGFDAELVVLALLGIVAPLSVL